jgi:hypothetical protein
MPDSLQTLLRDEARVIQLADKSSEDMQRVHDGLQLALIALADLLDRCAAIEARLDR